MDKRTETKSISRRALMILSARCWVIAAIGLLLPLAVFAEVELAFALVTDTSAQSKPYVRAEAACLQGFNEFAATFPDRYFARYHDDPKEPRCSLHHRSDPEFATPRAELTIRRISCPDGQWLNLADGECNAPRYFVTSETALKKPATVSGACRSCDRTWMTDEDGADALESGLRATIAAAVTDWGVNLASGERVVQEIDFRSYGPHPLVLVRQYNSHNSEDAGLGPGWRHQFMRNFQQERAPSAPTYDRDAPAFSRLYSTERDACQRGWRDIRAQAQPARLRASEARLELGQCNAFLGAQHVGRLAVHSTLGNPVAVAFQPQHEIEGAVYDSRQPSNAPPAVLAVSMQRPDGGMVRFVRDTRDGWRAPPASGYRLRDTADGKLLTTPARTEERYLADGRLDSVVNRAGMRLQMGYDDNRRLVRVTNHFGTDITFEYNASGHLIAATDSANLRYIFQYDEAFRLTGVEYPDHVRRSYSYDNSDHGLLNQIVGESNQVSSRWEYDASGRVVLSENAMATQRRIYHYHDEDQSTTVQEPSGATFTVRWTRISGHTLIEEIDYGACATCGRGKQSIQYNNDALPTLIRTISGIIAQIEYLPGTDLPRRYAELAGEQQRLTLWRWDPETRLLKCHTTDGLTTEYSHNDRGLVVRRTEFDTSNPTLFKGPITARNCTAISQRLDRGDIAQRSWTYSYTSNGQLAEEDGPRSDVADMTRYSYDSAGNLQRRVNPAGHTVEFMRYTGLGLPGRFIDENGIATDYGYDARGRVLYETRNSDTGNFVTTYEYLPSGRLARKTLANGAYLTYHYDNAQRLAGITNNGGERVSYGLDNFDRVIEETLRDRGGALVQRLTRQYDGLGNTLELKRGDRAIARFTYDSAGHLVTTTDALNNRTVSTYDGFGNLRGQTDALNHTTEYAYDHNNRLVSATDARGNTMRFIYDGFGNLRTSISPDAGSTVYSYDMAGNLIEQIDARGARARFSYDALNRLTRKWFPASPADATAYRYDDHRNGNRGVGRLASVRDNTGSSAYRYDDSGNLIQEDRVIDDVRYTWRYRYDEAGALTRLIYPSGRIVDYARDLQGRIVSLTTREHDDDVARVVAQDMVYDSSGELLSVSYGNGLFTRRQFDSERRLIGIQTLSRLLQVQNLRYDYDATDNVLAIVDLITPRRSQYFSYDHLHRLLTARGHYGDTQFRYDAAGNRIARIHNSVRSIHTENYVYAADSNRLLRVERGTGGIAATRSFSHDAAGNTLIDARGPLDKLVFAYDDNNRLINAQRGKQQTSYWYNSLGQRAMKISAGQAQHFHYDNRGNLLAETDADGHSVREYIYADGQRIAMMMAHTPRKAARLPADLIVDSEQDRTLKTGTWRNEQRASGFVGTNYLVHNGDEKQNSKTTDTQRVAWPLSVLESGEYAVHILWTSHPDRTPRARYTITHANGSTHVDLDQRREGGNWQLLGRYTFRRGERYEVSVVALAPGNLVADAVKLSWAGTQTPAPATATAFYFHNDFLGTPEILSDDYQNIVWSADITPFGETVETTSFLRQPLRLQGQYQDVETGLHYNYFRDYDPTLGRYIESDPSGLHGGTNAYAYVLPNPLRGIDPLGLTAHLVDPSRDQINPSWLKPGLTRSSTPPASTSGNSGSYFGLIPTIPFPMQFPNQRVVPLPGASNPATLTPRP